MVYYWQLVARVVKESQSLYGDSYRKKYSDRSKTELISMFGTF
jgi:hypothetical protein